MIYLNPRPKNGGSFDGIIGYLRTFLVDSHAQNAFTQSHQNLQGHGSSWRVVSSISFWEIGIKAKKGKLDIGVPFNRFCEQVQRTNILEIIAVDLAIWQENVVLKWDNPDPADRTIIATAKLRGLPILTADKRIRDFYPDCIW